MKKTILLTTFFFVYLNSIGQINFIEHTVIDNSHLTSGPTSVYSTDLDGDGDLDVLCSLYDGDKIAWYENTDGKGNLGQQKVISTELDGTSFVFPIDIDRDGDLDILSASELDNKIALYKNTDGKGAFGAQQIISDQEGVLMVFGADVDNDGDNDVIFSSKFEIAWSENIDGNGSFNPKKLISLDGESFSSIFPADMDNDGDIDILSSSLEFSNKVTWYKNEDGAGNFGTALIIDSTARGAASVHAGDLDGDGDMDVIAAAEYNDDVLWYENIDGKGDFSNINTVTLNFDEVTLVYAADIDGDLDLDIIAASSPTSRSKIAWFENMDGKGTFNLEKTVTDFPRKIEWIHAGDMDGDNDLDIFHASSVDDELAWHENTDGVGNFGLEKMISRDTNFPTAIFAADLDGDGDKDIVSGSQDERVAWYENLDGKGNYGLQKIIVTGLFTAPYIHLIDIDKDDDNDVVAIISGYPDNKIVWYENIDGKGNFSKEKIIESLTAAVELSIADIDGDEDTDIVAISDRNTIVWYDNIDGKGTFSTKKIVVDNIDNPISMHPADIDGDGDVDVCYGNGSIKNDGFHWIENIDGKGTFGSSIEISQYASYTRSMTSVDIDNDGDLDILGCTGDVVLYENDGNGNFTPKTTLTTFGDVDQVLSIDMDGDGDFDVLERSTGDDRIAWYENLDGKGGSFSNEKIIIPNRDFIGWFDTADIDDDGDLDILITSTYEDKISWIENLGTGNVDDFITIWKTDNPGSSENNQITIPTFPVEYYNYTVYWGDGTSDTSVTGNITHTYSTPGTYTVSISGDFPRIYFSDFTPGFNDYTGDEKKIISIKQWGSNSWTSMESAFAGCDNLNVTATDAPDLSNVVSLKNMFIWCIRLTGNESFADWDVSNITNTSYMFDKTSFNQDISGWNVQSVTDMSNMFYSSQFNHNINNWNVSGVVNMSGMFGSGLFNQDLSNWNVGNVQDMSYMFDSTYFNHDISLWDVSNVQNMSYMFSYSHFDQDISSWDVSNVNSMVSMFDDSHISDDNYDKLLIEWSQLPTLQPNVQLGANDAQFCMAEDARENLMNVYGWTINDSGLNCTEERPFITTWKTDIPGISNDNQITIPTHFSEDYNYTVNWGDGTTDTEVSGDITHTYATPGTYQVSISGKFPLIFFNDFPGIHGNFQEIGDHDKIISVDQWGTNRWFSLEFAFAGCNNLDINATDIPDFSRGGMRLTGMFLGCTSLVGNSSMNTWDLSPVNSTFAMFQEASNFNQPINDWNVSGVMDMFDMFKGASSFNQNLGNWDISSVYNMRSMFDDSGLSNENYNKMLIAWNDLPSLRFGVQLGANNNTYCEAEAARQSIIDSYGWTIVDAGKTLYCNEDNDNDGVLDQSDNCLNTPTGETVDVNGCSDGQLDDDNDGVINSMDHCPDSVGLVNENGCFELPSNNFSIEIVSETCLDKNNGHIKITANQYQAYVTLINDVEYVFTDQLAIDNLAPGSYNFCIGVENEIFEQCYTVEIAEGAQISGKIDASGSKSEIEILDGTPPFEVSVNGKHRLTTTSGFIELDVNDGDIIQVSSSKTCEGTLEKVVSLSNSLIVFPNPTQGEFEIILPDVIENNVVIEIYSTHAKLISSKNYTVVNKKVYVDLTNKPSGLYLIKVLTNKPVELKIIKQ